VKTLDRYLLAELLMPFVFGVGAFSSIIFASGKLFQLLDLLTKQGYSLGTIAQLFLLYSPGILRVTFPMAVLLACLLGLTRLSSDSEVTGFYAGGVSLYRMLGPLIGFSLLVTVGTFIFNETIVPAGEAAARRILEQHQGGQRATAVLLRYPAAGTPDRIIFAQNFDPRAGTLSNVDVFAFDRGEARLHIHSRTARWLGQTWEFREGYQETMGFPERQGREGKISQQKENEPTPETPTVGRIVATFGDLKVNLGKTPEEIERERKAPEEMTAAELSRQLDLVRRLEAGLEETASVDRLNAPALKVTLQMHYSVPLASLVFCLLGTPLGLRRHRTGSSTGLGLSVIVIFAYYVLLRYCGALAKNGELSPIIGAWLANILAVTAGLIMLARSPK